MHDPEGDRFGAIRVSIVNKAQIFPRTPHSGAFFTLQEDAWKVMPRCNGTATIGSGAPDLPGQPWGSTPALNVTFDEGDTTLTLSQWCPAQYAPTLESVLPVLPYVQLTFCRPKGNGTLPSDDTNGFNPSATVLQLGITVFDSGAPWRPGGAPAWGTVSIPIPLQPRHYPVLHPLWTAAWSVVDAASDALHGAWTRLRAGYPSVVSETSLIVGAGSLLSGPASEALFPGGVYGGASVSGGTTFMTTGQDHDAAFVTPLRTNGSVAGALVHASHVLCVRDPDLQDAGLHNITVMAVSLVDGSVLSWAEAQVLLLFEQENRTGTAWAADCATVFSVYFNRSMLSVLSSTELYVSLMITTSTGPGRGVPGGSGGHGDGLVSLHPSTVTVKIVHTNAPVRVSSVASLDSAPAALTRVSSSAWSTQVSLPENTAPGTVLATIHTADADWQWQSVQFTILSAGPAEALRLCPNATCFALRPVLNGTVLDASSGQTVPLIHSVQVVLVADILDCEVPALRTLQLSIFASDDARLPRADFPPTYATNLTLDVTFGIVDVVESRPVVAAVRSCSGARLQTEDRCIEFAGQNLGLPEGTVQPLLHLVNTASGRVYGPGLQWADCAVASRVGSEGTIQCILNETTVGHNVATLLWNYTTVDSVAGTVLNASTHVTYAPPSIRRVYSLPGNSSACTSISAQLAADTAALDAEVSPALGPLAASRLSECNVTGLWTVDLTLPATSSSLSALWSQAPSPWANGSIARPLCSLSLMHHRNATVRLDADCPGFWESGWGAYNRTTGTLSVTLNGAQVSSMALIIGLSTYDGIGTVRGPLQVQAGCSSMDVPPDQWTSLGMRWLRSPDSLCGEHAGAVVVVEGSGFGSSRDVSAGLVTARFGPTGKENVAGACVLTQDHFVLRCAIPPEAPVGASDRVSVCVGGLCSDVSVLGLAPPVVLRILPDVIPTTNGSAVVRIQGVNFGVQVGAEVMVEFGAVTAAACLDGLGHSIRCMPLTRAPPGACKITRAHTEVTCATIGPDGWGVALQFRVFATEQWSAWSVSRAGFAAPGITSMSPAVLDPLGGQWVQLTGASFGPARIARVIILAQDLPTEDIVYASHGLLMFRMPPGGGSNITVDVDVGGQVARTQVRYAQPTIGGLTYVTGDLDTAPLQLTAKVSFFPVCCFCGMGNASLLARFGEGQPYTPLAGNCSTDILASQYQACAGPVIACTGGNNVTVNIIALGTAAPSPSPLPASVRLLQESSSNRTNSTVAPGTLLEVAPVRGLTSPTEISIIVTTAEKGGLALSYGATVAAPLDGGEAAPLFTYSKNEVLSAVPTVDRVTPPGPFDMGGGQLVKLEGKNLGSAGLVWLTVLGQRIRCAPNRTLLMPLGTLYTGMRTYLLTGGEDGGVVNVTDTPTPQQAERALAIPTASERQPSVWTVPPPGSVNLCNIISWQGAVRTLPGQTDVVEFTMPPGAGRDAVIEVEPFGPGTVSAPRVVDYVSPSLTSVVYERATLLREGPAASRNAPLQAALNTTGGWIRVRGVFPPGRNLTAYYSNTLAVFGWDGIDVSTVPSPSAPGPGAGTVAPDDDVATPMRLHSEGTLDSLAYSVMRHVPSPITDSTILLGGSYARLSYASIVDAPVQPRVGLQYANWNTSSFRVYAPPGCGGTVNWLTLHTQGPGGDRALPFVVAYAQPVITGVRSSLFDVVNTTLQSANFAPQVLNGTEVGTGNRTLHNGITGLAHLALLDLWPPPPQRFPTDGKYTITLQGFNMFSPSGVLVTFSTGATGTGLVEGVEGSLALPSTSVSWDDYSIEVRSVPSFEGQVTVTIALYAPEGAEDTPARPRSLFTVASTPLQADAPWITDMTVVPDTLLAVTEGIGDGQDTEVVTTVDVADPCLPVYGRLPLTAIRPLDTSGAIDTGSAPMDYWLPWWDLTGNASFLPMPPSSPALRNTTALRSLVPLLYQAPVFYWTGLSGGTSAPGDTLPPAGALASTPLEAPNASALAFLAASGLRPLRARCMRERDALTSTGPSAPVVLEIRGANFGSGRSRVAVQVLLDDGQGRPLVVTQCQQLDAQTLIWQTSSRLRCKLQASGAVDKVMLGLGQSVLVTAAFHTVQSVDAGLVLWVACTQGTYAVPIVAEYEWNAEAAAFINSIMLPNATTRGSARSTCLPCAEGAFCLGFSSFPIALPGFWPTIPAQWRQRGINVMGPEYRGQIQPFIPCPEPGVCLFNASCNRGRDPDSWACTACPRGFIPDSTDGSCLDCSQQQGQVYVTAAALLVFGILFLAFTVARTIAKGSRMYEEQKNGFEPERPDFIEMMKLLIDFVQGLSALSIYKATREAANPVILPSDDLNEVAAKVNSLQVQMARAVTSLRIFTTLGFNSAQLRCVLPGFGTLQSTYFFLPLIVSAPVALSVFAWVGISWLVKRAGGKGTWSKINKRLKVKLFGRKIQLVTLGPLNFAEALMVSAACVFIVLFLSLNGVISSALLLGDCATVGEGGYLFSNPSISCYTDAHRTLQYWGFITAGCWVSIPVLILVLLIWPIAIPVWMCIPCERAAAGCTKLLTKKKKAAAEDPQFAPMSTAEMNVLVDTEAAGGASDQLKGNKELEHDWFPAQHRKKKGKTVASVKRRLRRLSIQMQGGTSLQSALEADEGEGMASGDEDGDEEGGKKRYYRWNLYRWALREDAPKERRKTAFHYFGFVFGDFRHESMAQQGAASAQEGRDEATSSASSAALQGAAAPGGSAGAAGGGGGGNAASGRMLEREFGLWVQQQTRATGLWSTVDSGTARPEDGAFTPPPLKAGASHKTVILSAQGAQSSKISFLSAYAQVLREALRHHSSRRDSVWEKVSTVADGDGKKKKGKRGGSAGPAGSRHSEASEGEGAVDTHIDQTPEALMKLPPHLRPLLPPRTPLLRQATLLTQEQSLALYRAFHKAKLALNEFIAALSSGYECVLLIKNAVFIVFGTGFFFTDGQHQLAASLISMVFFFVLHVLLRPFRMAASNVLTSIAIFTTILLAGSILARARIEGDASSGSALQGRVGSEQLAMQYSVLASFALYVGLWLWYMGQCLNDIFVSVWAGVRRFLAAPPHGDDAQEEGGLKSSPRGISPRGTKGSPRGPTKATGTTSAGVKQDQSSSLSSSGSSGTDISVLSTHSKPSFKRLMSTRTGHVLSSKNLPRPQDLPPASTSVQGLGPGVRLVLLPEAPSVLAVRLVCDEIAPSPAQIADAEKKERRRASVVQQQQQQQAGASGAGSSSGGPPVVPPLPFPLLKQGSDYSRHVQRKTFIRLLPCALDGGRLPPGEEVAACITLGLPLPQDTLATILSTGGKRGAKGGGQHPQALTKLTDYVWNAAKTEETLGRRTSQPEEEPRRKVSPTAARSPGSPEDTASASSPPAHRRQDPDAGSAAVPPPTAPRKTLPAHTVDVDSGATEAEGTGGGMTATHADLAHSHAGGGGTGKHIVMVRLAHGSDGGGAATAASSPVPIPLPSPPAPPPSRQGSTPSSSVLGHTGLDGEQEEEEKEDIGSKAHTGTSSKDGAVQPVSHTHDLPHAVAHNTVDVDSAHVRVVETGHDAGVAPPATYRAAYAPLTDELPIVLSFLHRAGERAGSRADVDAPAEHVVPVSGTAVPAAIPVEAAALSSRRSSHSEAESSLPSQGLHELEVFVSLGVPPSSSSAPLSAAPTLIPPHSAAHPPAPPAPPVTQGIGAQTLVEGRGRHMDLAAALTSPTQPVLPASSASVALAPLEDYSAAAKATAAVGVAGAAGAARPRGATVDVDGQGEGRTAASAASATDARLGSPSAALRIPLSAFSPLPFVALAVRAASRNTSAPRSVRKGAGQHISVDGDAVTMPALAPPSSPASSLGSPQASMSGAFSRAAAPAAAAQAPPGPGTGTGTSAVVTSSPLHVPVAAVISKVQVHNSATAMPRTLAIDEESYGPSSPVAVTTPSRPIEGRLAGSASRTGQGIKGPSTGGGSLSTAGTGGAQGVKPSASGAEVGGPTVSID